MSVTSDKVRRITDEILAFLMGRGVREIDMSMRNEESGYRIIFKANCSEEKCTCNVDGQHLSDKLNKFLKMEKNEGIEDYYWELAGDGDGCKDSELQLVGQMVDDGSATMEDNYLRIEIFKKKRH